ncbi:HLA class II histocompatibility antigen, DQ alpha 1 chain [Manis javanica]|nr:HLA class II histocompatibility antigen, DQ alpha 1 chain [Manis javanica]
MRPAADGGLVLHYDPQIAVPMQQMTPEMAQAGEALLWQLYDQIKARVLLVRGQRAGPRAQLFRAADRHRDHGVRREHDGPCRCGGRHPQDHRWFRNDAGGDLSGACQRAPESPAGSDRQGLWRELATLAVETNKLMRVQQQARGAELGGQYLDDEATQTENVRKMLLGFSRDLRVVLLRLASRLQTLRYYAASKRPVSPGIAREALTVFAPLANRLGIWQIKWELEDLSLRFLGPETYREVARLLDEKRVEREAYMEQMRARLEADLRATASAQRCRAGPSTSTASSRRCAASR